MGETTGITWTDHTFNPWIGCTKISKGCDHCYAETLATGRMQRKWGPGAPRIRTSAHNWNEPRRWNRKARQDGTRHRVFCASLADVFDSEVPQEWRDDLWKVVYETPYLDWQILTKRTRAKWMLKCLPQDWGDGYPNVWLGSSVEDQATYDRRVPELLNVPARIHWLSVEPQIDCIVPSTQQAVDWYVIGGESGRGSRPIMGGWVIEWMEHCAATGKPIFFKQWGDASPDRQIGVHHGGDLWQGKQYHEFPL